MDFMSKHNLNIKAVTYRAPRHSAKIRFFAVDLNMSIKKEMLQIYETSLF